MWALVSSEAGSTKEMPIENIISIRISIEIDELI